ncbi:MAG: hypothetical protein JNK15_16805 [Planctomycetes bacterium]|nr:hypothetical protein [Planctomycetota bacterium]
MRLPPLPSFVVLTLVCTVSAQEGVPQPAGLIPEQMWYAPTAADWAKPVAIRWQRTWDDAVALSQQTKKPILVCVNMDGEIASEHYAGVRYRDPELAKLWEPYVCVIASVYRHTPRDYDDQGRRIPCPRLGNVTCGEHMALEPLVYEKFLDGKRISPRHIMVELDGKEVFDVFYTWDTQSVFDTLRDGIQKRAFQAPPVVKGDRSLKEQLQSPDSDDREAIERMYAAASPEERKALLELAVGEGKQAPLELLRLAAWGLDPDLARKARAGMLQAEATGTIDLLADALRIPMAAEERQALAQSLRRFAGQSVKAQTLATAHTGLAGQKSAIDPSKWTQALAGQSYAAAADLAGEAEARDAAVAQKPADPQARLDLAESSLLQAYELTTGTGRGAAKLAQQQRQLLLEDARRAVDEAKKLGATGWRPAALAALCARAAGDDKVAYELAIAAAPQLPPEAPGRVAMELLALFAEARQQAIRGATMLKQDWDPSWMSDVHTTYSLLLAHPLGTDQHVAHHVDFLQFFGSPDTDLVLDRGLVKFPASPLLHERLRTRLLERGGVDALATTYDQKLQAADAPPAMAWFAGYAQMVAAEMHRKHQQPDQARAAYERAIELFGRYRDASCNQDGEHYVTMAHGGIARLVLQSGDRAGAFAALQKAFAGPAAAIAATDGLGITTMQTAEMLRGNARDAKDDALLQQLEAALQRLPKEAFELPEYERASRGQGAPGGQGGRRRRG